jgi:muconolactone delta-isomerase
MRFFVIEKVRAGAQMDPKEFVKMAAEDLEYKRKLEKAGKIIGGPCLDILGDGFILETKTIEEMGEIFFASPTNLHVDREIHPLGTFKDSLEGMKELRKK